MVTPDSVWRLDDSGTVSLVAEDARDGSNGESLFDGASRLAADDVGNLYVAEGPCIRRIDASGAMTTFAGTGERSEGWRRPEPPPDPRDYPEWVGADGAGIVYYFDGHNERIRRIDPSGEIVTVLALNDSPDIAGDWDDFRDRVAVDSAGNLFVIAGRGHAIRKVDASGNSSAFAGTGEYGTSGDGGPATLAKLAFPAVIGTDGSGNLYALEPYGGRVRKIDTSGTISTVAGPPDEYGPDEDESPADAYVTVRADFGEAASVAVDAAGNLHISDWEGDRVLRIEPSGTVHAFYGPGIEVSPDDYNSFEADDSDLADGKGFLAPRGLTADAAGTVYLADSGNDRVCAISPEGVIQTVAGTGKPGFSGDGGPATEAGLRSPSGVAVDASGNLYIADSGNCCVRKVDASGVICSMF